MTDDIVVNDPVDGGVPGEYTVTYDVSDEDGNAATQVTRTVTVVDTTAPVITRTGPSSVTVECGSVYTDEGATASDDCDGDLTNAIDTVNNVNTSAPGEFTISYDVSDGEGIPAVQVTRTVVVVDTAAPEITLTGSPGNHPGMWRRIHGCGRNRLGYL